LKVGISFFTESSYAFGIIRRVTGHLLQMGFVINLLFKGYTQRSVERPLAQADAQGWASRQFLSQGAGLIHQIIMRHNFVDQPDFGSVRAVAPQPPRTTINRPAMIDGTRCMP